MDFPMSPCADALPRTGILIVDDEPAIRALLLAALPAQGFTVFAVADGQEALALYQQHQAEIAMILLDVRMPGMDGPKILESIREINPALRCCFMTGNPGQYTEQELLALGSACVVQKPFGLAELVQVLRWLMAN